jgi:hypothetical protein
MATLVPTARVTPDDVLEIIETELSHSIINAFINTGHQMVQSTLLNKGLSADTLTEIEKWLSAHFLAIRDQRVESEAVGGEWQVRYQGTTGMGLQATTYGQMALTLDTSGSLATMNAGLKVATFEVYAENNMEADV